MVQQVAGSTFPWGTLVINVTGSLLLGFLYGFLEGTAAPAHWMAFLGVGVCGGYTTFSTFSYETAHLLQAREWDRGSLYILASVLLSLVATFVGLRLAAIVLQRG